MYLYKYFVIFPGKNALDSKLSEGIAHRLSAALSTIPDTEAWLHSAALLLVLTLVSLPIGFHLGFLQLEVLKASWGTVAGVMANCVLTPAITEELFFRVLLLPHPAENPSTSAQWLWGCISLAIFIAYHPLNGLSFFPAGRTTFKEPVFLLLAALLGVVCTLAYWQSGSLWPPVVIHWVVVVVWLLWLGGFDTPRPKEGGDS